MHSSKGYDKRFDQKGRLGRYVNDDVWKGDYKRHMDSHLKSNRRSKFPRRKCYLCRDGTPPMKTIEVVEGFDKCKDDSERIGARMEIDCS